MNDAVPSAMAATAWTPPRTWISSAPPRCIAAIVSGCGPPWFGGVQAVICPTPGDARRNDAHMRRRDHRIAAARHIAADLPDGNVAMAEHDAGQGLDFDITQRGALDLGKMANLLLREFDVLDRLWR